MIKIQISQELMKKINYLSRNFDFEVGGWITGEIKDGIIYLDELLIPNQDVSSSHVHFSPEDLINLRREYGDKVFKIIAHWHSHHKMSAYFSEIDEDLMSEIMETKDFFIFIVSNYQKNVVRISCKNPIRYDINDEEIVLVTQEDDTLLELKEKVEKIYNNSKININTINRKDDFLDYETEVESMNIEDDRDKIPQYNNDIEEDNERIFEIRIKNTKVSVDDLKKALNDYFYEENDLEVNEIN